MKQNIYVVKDKISGLMTSQLMCADNDLVAIKGFSESLKNINKDLVLDQELYRLGSVDEYGTIEPISVARLLPNEQYSSGMVRICSSQDYEEAFNNLIEKYKENVGEED